MTRCQFQSKQADCLKMTWAIIMNLLDKFANSRNESRVWIRLTELVLWTCIEIFKLLNKASYLRIRSSQLNNNQTQRWKQTIQGSLNSTKLDYLFTRQNTFRFIRRNLFNKKNRCSQNHHSFLKNRLRFLMVNHS